MKFYRNTIVTVLMFLLTTILLTACNSISTSRNTDLKEYTGQEIKVGVIGEVPKVKEKNVNLVPIDFTDFENQNIDSYDGIIITKEYLSQASENKYAGIYNNSNKPFFFIQSDKSYLPFADDQTTYDEAIKVKNESYATGYINTNEIVRYWELSLDNKVEPKEAVKGVFSQIFMLIEKIKIAKSDKFILNEDVQIEFTVQ